MIYTFHIKICILLQYFNIDNLQALGIMTILTAVSYYVKKHKWSTVKSTKLMFYPKK